VLLFFHGYQSSNKTDKFKVIRDTKRCVTVDYDSMSYKEVKEYYSSLSVFPTMLVGHSLGGYWALLLSIEYGIPCVLVNPSLSPKILPDYPSIDLRRMNNDSVPRIAYLELGDEVLDMHQVRHSLNPYMKVRVSKGGHHRVENLEMINNCIEELKRYEAIG